MERVIVKSASTTTIELNKALVSKADNPLRLSSVGTENSDAQHPASVLSSIQQTAVALVSVARDQAAKPSRRALHAGSVRDVVTQRMEFAIQRANADQARRVADCLHAAFEAFIEHTSQPCIALNEFGYVTRCNPAMALWTGIEGTSAMGQPLSALFCAESAESIEDANNALRECEQPNAPDEDPVFVLDGVFKLQTGELASRVSLLPVYIIPRVVETVIVLFRPL